MYQLTGISGYIKRRWFWLGVTDSGKPYPDFDFYKPTMGWSFPVSQLRNLLGSLLQRNSMKHRMPHVSQGGEGKVWLVQALNLIPTAGFNEMELFPNRRQDLLPSSLLGLVGRVEDSCICASLSTPHIIYGS